MNTTKRSKRSGRSVPALAPADALDMLASAVNYCREAGLSVCAGNDPALGLVLAIPDAHLDHAGQVIRFCMGKLDGGAMAVQPAAA
jgi:hypothetical protein